MRLDFGTTGDECVEATADPHAGKERFEREVGKYANCYSPVEDVDMEGGIFRTHLRIRSL